MSYTFSGYLKQLYTNHTDGSQMLVFSPCEDFNEAFDDLIDCGKLELKIGKYRAKRSLEANSYFHALVGKIADALDISKTHCKNILITRYGQQDFLPDGTMAVIKSNVPPEQMWEQEWLHVLPFRTQTENDAEVYFYKIFRGSHTYDSREMSALIDGTVAEAKELGVDTITENEKREMMERYGQKHPEN